MYYKNYSEIIYTGLENSKCTINGNEFDNESFLNELIERTNIVNKDGGRIFFFGNGASEAFSNHMALDWSKNGKILSLSLSDSSLLTALANDYSYEDAFVEFLKIYNINDKDIVVTISSSGNSPNISRVIDYCVNNNIDSISLSGLNKNNYSAKNSKYSYFIDLKTYGMVECLHQIFLHIWLDCYMNIEEWNKTTSQNMNSNNFIL